MQSEEDEGTEPRQRCDEQGHVPKRPDANLADCVEIFEDEVFEIFAHLNSWLLASCRWLE